MNLNLKELLSVPGCPVALHGNVDSTQVARHIRGVEIDSRKVVPGTLFIAIRGERLDGHQFIPDAIKQGVAAMVVDEAWFNQTRDPHLDGLFLVVADTLVALQEFSKFYRRKFSIPVIGLTGSVGKTTTKEMLAAVLSQKYNVHKNEGNLNNHYGVPLTLFKIAENHEIAIIEMGANHFGEIARLAEIAEPTHAIITAVGRAHLEFFGSLEGVARAKLELFDAIKDSGLAFVNADDARIESNVPALKRQIRFGFENDADIKGRIVNIDTNGCVTFDLRGQQIQLRTPGVHQAKNALAAAAVALEFGIDIRQIKEALEAYAPVSKRMEVIDIQGIRIINDCYNSNPDSANSALDVLNGMETSGQKISVMADMLELGTARRGRTPRNWRARRSTQYRRSVRLWSDDAFHG